MQAPIRKIEITKHLFKTTVMFSAMYETHVQGEELPWHSTSFADKKEFLDWLSDRLDEMEVKE